MFGAIDKTDLQPGETAARKRANYKHGATDNSGEPRASMWYFMF